MFFKNNRIKAVLLLSLALISTQLTAQEPGSGIEFRLKPAQCVALHQGQDCYVAIEINWQSAGRNNYCLFSSQQKQALQCWSMAVKGHFQREVVARENVQFTLKIQDDNKVIASAELEMAWVYKKSKASHSSWRLF